MRNARNGFPGRYLGTELNPKAGYLLRGEYARYGEILYGVSIESLRKLGRPIDIFINDCYHSAACEANEDETIVDRLDAGGYVLGDSAHVTDKLEALARCTGRNFVLFKEQPYLHWYPRTGIGITFSPRETKGDTLSKQ